jgi:hypothetical protein
MSGHQHELFMMALTAVLSIIIGFLGGRIWEAFRSFDEEALLSRDEIALVTANRLREKREESAPRKPSIAARRANIASSKSRRRAAGSR